MSYFKYVDQMFLSVTQAFKKTQSTRNALASFCTTLITGTARTHHDCIGAELRQTQYRQEPLKTGVV